VKALHKPGLRKPVHFLPLAAARKINRTGASGLQLRDIFRSACERRRCRFMGQIRQERVECESKARGSEAFISLIDKYRAQATPEDELVLKTSVF
jgi:hypothetical protein